MLEAAARILETRGLGGYNTNDIASVAGVSIGSLYQYFPNKDAITSALVIREMDALRGALERLDAPAGWPRVALLIEVAVDNQLGRSKLSRLLDLEEERLPLTTELAERRRTMKELIRSLLADVPMTFAASVHAADDIVAIVKGMVDSAGERGESERAPLIDRVTRTVLGYLQGPMACR